jgi:hypothetical protein
MQAAERIRAAVARVTALRRLCQDEPAQLEGMSAIKQFQARRFACTYADILAPGGPFAKPARFFLDELYGERDYALRDQQFARIAGALQRMLPDDAVDTAVALAELHALSEDLDHAMALAWLRQPELPACRRYMAAWRAVGCAAQRQQQLDTVLQLGRELGRLTRKSGLRVMLRMMRGPAAAAGLADLQRFLESGFEHFAAMKAAQVPQFLQLIEHREAQLLRSLEGDDTSAALALLAGVSGKAP